MIHIKETAELEAAGELLSDLEIELLQAAVHEGESLLETDFDDEAREEALTALRSLERHGLLALGPEGWEASGAAEERLLQHDDIVRAKWSMDGATTLVEAAAKLREYAAHLEAMAQEGWVLNDAVQDDYGFLRRSRESVAAAKPA